MNFLAKHFFAFIQKLLTKIISKLLRPSWLAASRPLVLSDSPLFFCPPARWSLLFYGRDVNHQFANTTSRTFFQTLCLTFVLLLSIEKFKSQFDSNLVVGTRSPSSSTATNTLTRILHRRGRWLLQSTKISRQG